MWMGYGHLHVGFVHVVWALVVVDWIVSGLVWPRLELLALDVGYKAHIVLHKITYKSIFSLLHTECSPRCLKKVFWKKCGKFGPRKISPTSGGFSWLLALVKGSIGIAKCLPAGDMEHRSLSYWRPNIPLFWYVSSLRRLQVQAQVYGKASESILFSLLLCSALFPKWMWTTINYK